MAMKNLSLFIFRRDLRLEDNTGLIATLAASKQVIPCFIFTPQQIEHNAFRSDACLQFMIESLQDLESQLQAKGAKLYLFYGKPEEIVAQCIQKLQVDSVVVNRDYTPFSQTRDQQIEAICQQQNVPFFSFDDLLLNPPEATLKADGTPYSIFTPFFRNASKWDIQAPKRNSHTNYYQQSISFAKKDLYPQILPTFNPKQTIPGGRKAALHILRNLPDFANYGSQRDIPAIHGTTHLSPHLKFATCSVREIYFAIAERLGRDHDLIRQLYWRDFFTTIGFYFPHIYKGAFRQKFDQLPWDEDKKRFKLWCEGQTGFPIVDAGMREMNETGWMHNRVRMIVASFLVKDLHLPWQWGEKYFAQKLIDYDPAVNNGNWQWSAGTGCDAQPYFRIFNPWSQQKKFDPDCIYIYRWIPELKSLTAKEIHEWFLDKHHSLTSSYPSPIVTHDKEAKLALKRFHSCENESETD